MIKQHHSIAFCYIFNKWAREIEKYKKKRLNDKIHSIKIIEFTKVADKIFLKYFIHTGFYTIKNNNNDRDV